MTAARTTRPGRGRRRALLSLLTALAGITMTQVADVPEAAAHSDLTASAPSAGSRGSVPNLIRLTFSDTVEPTFVSVALTIDQAKPITLPTQVNGSEVVATPPTPNTTTDSPQEWDVAYRVVSQDGHPIIGTISFTVTAPARAASNPTTTSPTTPATSSAPATPAATSTPATPAASSAPPTSTLPPGSPVESDSHPSPGLPFLILVGVLLFVGPVLAGLVQLLPARPKTDEQPAADPPAQDAENGQPPTNNQDSSETDRPASAQPSNAPQPEPESGIKAGAPETTSADQTTREASAD